MEENQRSPQLFEIDKVVFVDAGASDGGIQALKVFFEAIQPYSGTAYVVVPRLSSERDSHLVQTLQAVSAIPVAEVTEKIKILPDHAYVIPPNMSASMVNGHIVVSAVKTIEGRRAPIDNSFRTLDESQRERAAVILSDAGADGSMVLRSAIEKPGTSMEELRSLKEDSIAAEDQELSLKIDDVTNQGALEGSQRLQSVEEQLKFQTHLLEAVEQAVIATDPEGQVIYWNRFAEKMYGWRADEVKGRNIMDITPSQLAIDQAEEIMSLLREGQSWSGEFNVMRRDGTVFPAQVFDYPIRDENGNLRGIVGVSIDVTERRRAEDALRVTNERLRLLIESASDYAIFTLDPDRRINLWNPGAEKVFGWSEQEAVGQLVDIIFTLEDRAKGVPEQEIRTALEKGRSPDERFHLRKDGSLFFASGVMTVIKNKAGEVQGFTKIAHDMSDRLATNKAIHERALLQRLVAAQEDERRRIARDLHDELGQQMVALRLKLDHLSKLPQGAQLHDELLEIQKMAARIDDGVDFLAWEIRPAILDDFGLSAALERYIQQWSAYSGIEAQLVPSKLKNARFTPEVEINLYRIVQEALNNTFKYAQAKSVAVILDRRDDLIVLIVEDDGIGFRPQGIAKNNSQGMGLTSMKERAELIGATFEIESTVGEGTTIYVTLPAEALVGKNRI